MDERRTYADRRLELGDMIRAALHLARESGRRGHALPTAKPDLFAAYEQNKAGRFGADAARPHRATHRKLTR